MKNNLQEEGSIDQEKWSSEVERISELKDKVYAEIKRVYDRDKHDKWFEITGEILSNLESNGKSEEDLQRYAAYHFLLMGTPGIELSPLVDLPGELSIEKAFRSKLEELLKL